MTSTLCHLVWTADAGFIVERLSGATKFASQNMVQDEAD